VPHDTLSELDAHRDDRGVFGIAYGVRQSDKDAVLDYLQIREAGGYSMIYVDLFESHDSTQPILKNALLFTGTVGR
jgi:cation transport regulator ChaC